MRALVAAVGVALLITGCGSTTAPARHESVAVRPFAAADATVPAGYHVEWCPDLRPRGTRMTAAVAIPDGVSLRSTDGGGCGFADDQDRRSLGILLGVGQSVATFRRKELEPFVGSGGDDDIEKVRLDRDVAAFGGLRGDRLDWYAYADGSPSDVRLVQAGGVRVTWATPAEGPRRLDELQQALDSLGVRRGTGLLCGGVRLRVPVPQTESIEVGRGRCHLYLQPGRESLLRYAEVVTAPATSLAAKAARLRKRSSVTSVRLERRAATLDGRRVDRLTWVVHRLHETSDYQPPGTWRLVTLGDSRLQVTWGATPARWRVEGDVARRFFAGVRAVPDGATTLVP